MSTKNPASNFERQFKRVALAVTLACCASPAALAQPADQDDDFSFTFEPFAGVFSPTQLPQMYIALGERALIITGPPASTSSPTARMSLTCPVSEKQEGSYAVTDAKDIRMLLRAETRGGAITAITYDPRTFEKYEKFPRVIVMNLSASDQFHARSCVIKDPNAVSKDCNNVVADHLAEKMAAMREWIETTCAIAHSVIPISWPSRPSPAKLGGSQSLKANPQNAR